MNQKVVREFTLWALCWVAGTSVLATEIAVKVRQPRIIETAATIAPAVLPAAQAVTSAPKPPPPGVLPEEKVTGLLIDSVIQVESRGNPRTVGKRGERGLMQIKSGTWADTTRKLYGRSISFSRAFEPELNRKVGTAYLAHIHQFLQENRQHWKSDERALMLACYNAGPGRVEQARFNVRRLPPSTRDYVERVTALHDHFLEQHAVKLTADRRYAMQIVPLAGSPNRDS